MNVLSSNDIVRCTSRLKKTISINPPNTTQLHSQSLTAETWKWWTFQVQILLFLLVSFSRWTMLNLGRVIPTAASINLFGQFFGYHCSKGLAPVSRKPQEVMKTTRFSYPAPEFFKFPLPHRRLEQAAAMLCQVLEVDSSLTLPETNNENAPENRGEPQQKTTSSIPSIHFQGRKW